MNRLALLLAVLTALPCAHRWPHHRPVALALAALLAVDCARLVTAGAARGSAPWWADVALAVGWYVGPVAMGWKVFARHGARKEEKRGRR